MSLLGFDPPQELESAIEQARGANRRTYAVPLEAYRRGDQYVLVADAPGVDIRDIDVRVERNVVTITVQRRPAFAPDDLVLVDERPRGEFVRRLLVGEMLDSSRFTAHLGSGVLTVLVPTDHEEGGAHG
ncbi:Hsp20/alpha crystallin family protein [Leifsonia sp. F6_8S_P_1B]|uniref:Hsp20/alpha crystallin family protein n=1 Tax=Leifsonia williamsii TaxID=3035919 RepID=A0ABT8KFV6_9MICO|nr:Hsp20/alpha crystallin family protein [Leifsonia williamsii]MDN4616330.1 Hsp20/alpha crystallin family protein [Leifsonia williamsii]